MDGVNMVANKEIDNVSKFVLDTKLRMKPNLEEELVIWFFAVTLIGRVI
jgi:hypothetical protein